MALALHIPEQNPTTGTRGNQVKPITEGERRIAVPDQQAKTGFWGVLDDLGTTVVNGVKDVAGAVAQREVDRIATGPESTVTTEGDPTDQPGGVNATQKAAGFVDKYKTELMIGGAVVAGLIVLLVVTRD